MKITENKLLAGFVGYNGEFHDDYVSELDGERVLWVYVQDREGKPSAVRLRSQATGITYIDGAWDAVEKSIPLAKRLTKKQKVIVAKLPPLTVS